MEEADLLKERLQFITDKRRIQEEIAQKRRQIEEEKLKLQYIKKKALRDQWLMDGLSQQSEEEQEALRLQNQDEQQQSQDLQSNILRMEQEIQDLETQELNMSANEEAVLKRLKEVERTAEDIIKKAASSAESDGKEVNQGCGTADNHNSFSVTMETAEQLEPAMGCEVEVAVDDSPELVQDFSANDQQVYSGTNSSPPVGGQLAGPTAGTEEPNPPACGGSEGPDPPDCTDLKEPEEFHQGLKEDPVREELNRNESVTSSVSDSPSSADSVYENEAHRKRQDTSEQDPETDRNPDTDRDPEPGPKPEPEPDQGPEQDQDPVQHHQEHLEEDSLTAHSLLIEPEPQPDPDREQDPEADLMVDPQIDEDPDLDSFPQPELDPDLDSFPQPELIPDLDSFPQPDLDLDLYPDPEPDPELGLYSELECDSDLHPEDDGYENLPVYPDDDPEVLEVQFDPPIVEESVLEQRIREEVMSDGSNESCQDQDQNLDLDQDCEDLVESDEETDEKWRTIFSSSINKEDDDSYLDSLELSAQDLFVQKVEVTDFTEQQNDDFEEVSFQVPRVEKVLEQPEEVVSFPVPPQEVKYNPLGLQGLSKISEDESETARDAGQNQGKKLPKDFCVIQETRSENVSTEHVDFQLARKQWREMEEQTKSKVVLPTKKQPTFHSSHSFMYTPVRNIERVPRKANDLESLNLVGEYPHTQFSPCSEDSGLDDSSFRSPYDDPETPVEREIRLSLEREESFRKERALSRMGKSTDCAPSRGMPRSISTPLTPSFIITSSTSSEPGGDGNSSRDKLGKDDSSQWRSEDGGSSLIILETSNLIIRSASEFSLSQACDQPQEKSFLNNPFFKLRSRSSVSLVDEEIRMVKQREEELKKERENLYGRERMESERNNRLDTLTFTHSVDVPMKCKSSPSSPMKTAYRMDRSTLSCDHRFPDVYAGGRRKSAMALRWEAGEFTKND